MRTKKKSTRTQKQLNIVSVHLPPAAKAKLDDVCFTRGMSIKMLLGRLIIWFVDLNRTEQSIVLGQIEVSDINNLAEMLMKRGKKPAKRKK